MDPSYYSDWGDPREFTLSDMGVGECAGEVVSQTQFALAGSERELFESQIQLDSEEFKKAVRTAYASMVHAAQGLIKAQNADVSEDEDVILTEFRKRFCDSKIFYDKYAGSKFADLLFKANESLKGNGDVGRDLARQRIEEAQLFIDAAHSCYGRLMGAATIK